MSSRLVVACDLRTSVVPTLGTTSQDGTTQERVQHRHFAGTIAMGGAQSYCSADEVTE